MIPCRQLRGFTLIEVLLATAIFAVISLASFSVLDGVIRTKEGVEDKQAQLNKIQRAWLTIERDLLQIAWRSVRAEGEAPLTNYLFANMDDFGDADQSIAFVRAGWSNPNLVLPRSDLQSVAYRIQDEKLERLHFNFVDPVVGEEPKVRVLIEDVESLGLRFFIDNKWRDALQENNWPEAIEFEIKSKKLGVISRKFLTVKRPQTPSAAQSGNNGGNSGDSNDSGNTPESQGDSPEEQQ